MKGETIFDHLQSLRGDDLERAYSILRERVVAQRARQLERLNSTRPCYLRLLANKPPGAGTTAIRARLTDRAAELSAWTKPGDKVLQTTRLAAWPSAHQLAGLIGDVFCRLNPDWEMSLSTFEHNDGQEVVARPIPRRSIT